MLSFNQTQLYQEDWIGLKSLNEQGKVDFLISEGDHLQFTDKFLFHIIETYLADWINTLFEHCLQIWTLSDVSCVWYPKNGFLCTRNQSEEISGTWPITMWNNKKQNMKH